MTPNKDDSNPEQIREDSDSSNRKLFTTDNNKDRDVMGYLTQYDFNSKIY